MLEVLQQTIQPVSDFGEMEQEAFTQALDAHVEQCSGGGIRLEDHPSGTRGQARDGKVP